ncbi:MAG: HAMP domain-containing protein, partial [Alphaproteobacteria bacterium]|nr:HAMP domain-containing protein [Alphaproteobacteria bacterium]
MTALAKLFRTTAFKLSLVYLAIFAIGSSLVIGWTAWNVRRLVEQQIRTAIEAEIKGLSEQYAQGGVRRLVFVVDRRTRQPGASLYLVTNFQGLRIAGNVAALPPGVLDNPGAAETAYQRDDSQSMDRHALARIFVLPGGFRLLVGRDLEDRDTIYSVMGRALITSLMLLIVFGTLGGLFVARRVLRRVDAMNASAQTIMHGDFSGRLPVAGSNDELDRLAVNLNSMIERIAGLMDGLKQVSDNIAHDLKTPLTRLRARAEQALRTAENEADHRAALEKVIEESDNLLRIFNALLMIARAEAGSASAPMENFDMVPVIRDVVEMYEPVAE